MGLHLNLLIMATRYVTIQSESDLSETWRDAKCPNFEWGFNEQTLSECSIVDAGYEASYDTLEVSTGEEMSWTYLCADTNTTKTYTIQSGEYGVKA